MSAGVYPTSANCAARGFVIVAYRRVPGPPPLLNAVSGTAPVSHISVPRGCATRKHGTDIMVVASSSFLSWYGDVSGISSFPQSKTYRRSDFGGCALRCAMVNDTIATTAKTASRRFRDQ